MTEIIPNEKLFEWYIRITDLQDNFIGDFDSVTDVIKKLNIKNPSIGNINSTIAGKRKYAYGYKWYRLSRPFKLLDGEIFRYCANLNNLYGVSNYGRVISLQFHGKEGCKQLAQNSIKIGYKVVKNDDVKEIKKIMKDKITVFAGQSGAGKSSLLNRLDKTLSLQTNEISKALGRGKHTTRCVTLYEINGGLVADTPGFSSVDFHGMTKLDIRDNMKEMFDNLEFCKYRDCIHIKEDNCQVKQLVENGEILLSRYNNYKSFIGGK